MKAALFICTAFLPVAFLPARFEAHETYRAGILLIAVAIALPALWRTKGFNRLLLFAIAAWTLALILSTVFALSFSRAFFGDLIRDTGLITQLTLIAIIFVGAWLNLSEVWRWFWVAGVVVAAYVTLQSTGFIPNPLAERAYGPLGAPTYTGGWLALAALWVIINLLSEGRLLSTLKRLVISAGMLFMMFALLLTGSRGALLAVGTGFLIAVLIWTAVNKKRTVALAILFLIIGAAGGFLALNGIDWRNSPLASLPLIARLNPDLPDTPRDAREKIWAGTLNLAHNWPALSDMNGEPDPYASLRPLVGYGLESFEQVFRPYVDSELRLFEGGHPVDRAHNDWLDTIITTGWVGLLARAALWITTLYVGLKRMNLAGIRFILMFTIGIIAGIIIARDTPLLPVAATAGGLAALIIWLVLQTFHSRPAVFDIRACIALAVLAAHIVDLQFFFTTAATAVPAYLALGLLLVPEQSAPQQTPDSTPLWLWVGFGGAWLLRALMMLNANAVAYILLPFMIVPVRLFVPLTRREMMQIALLWLIGWVAGFIQSSEMIALSDLMLLLALLWLLPGFSITQWPWLNSRQVLLSLVIVVALILWASSTIAYIHLNQAMQTNSTSTSVDNVQIAVNLRPWDDRLSSLAGIFAYESALNRLDAPDKESLNHAALWVEHAIQLNPFDPAYPIQLAEIQIELDSLRH